MKKTKFDFDLIVLGSGAGGSAAGPQVGTGGAGISGRSLYPCGAGGPGGSLARGAAVVAGDALPRDS